MSDTTIIGGGIAGTVLAAALARAGHTTTLLEQQPAETSGGGGAFLFLDARGHEALYGLGVDQTALFSASHAIDGLDYTTSTGIHSSRMDRGHRFWLRRNLISVLQEYLDGADAHVHHGAAVTGITRDAEALLLHRDGLEALLITDELVIGADGIDSVVRAEVEPERVPTYSGDIVLYGMTAAHLELPTTPDVLHFYAEVAPGGPASTFGHVWSRAEGTTALWFLRIPREPLERDDLGMRPVAEWNATVLEATPSNGAIVETLLAHTDSVHVSNARDVLLDGAADPGNRVLLIGDADHAITPAAGIGARDALEDAHAVYQAITTGGSPAAAMAARRQKILTDRAAARRVTPRPPNASSRA
ncbi:FAD-dependent oxidoreductase [Nocardia sp. NPDC051570]|uniref:FAD-dependent oxidoreductase n=1 Tax=Nocardia sp. NPDC051570 TaxID=3364324 RepID=UPI00378BF830